MSGDITPPITQDLMVLKAHVLTQPNLMLGNLVAVMRWNAVRELYLVSWWGDLVSPLEREPQYHLPSNTPGKGILIIWCSVALHQN